MSTHVVDASPSKAAPSALAAAKGSEMALSQEQFGSPTITTKELTQFRSQTTFGSTSELLPTVSLPIFPEDNCNRSPSNATLVNNVDADDKDTIEYKRLGAKSPCVTLLSLSLGPLLSNIFTSLVSIVLSVYVSKALLNSNAAVAALTIAAVPEFIANSIAWALLIGSSATVSGSLGKGDIIGARTAAINAVTMALIFGILMLIIMLPSARQILLSLASSEHSSDIISIAYDYIFVFICGIPITALNFTLNGIMSGTGNVKLVSICNIIDVVLTLGVFAPIFLFVPATNASLGVRGASLAIVLSRTLVCLIYLYVYIFRGNVRMDWRLLHQNRTFAYVKAILGVGCIDLISSLSGTVILGIVSTFVSKLATDYANRNPNGNEKQTYEEVMASWACLNRIYNLVVAISFGVTGGYLAPASYAYGRKLYDRFISLTWSCFIYDSVLLLLLGVLFIIIIPWFSQIFSTSELYTMMSTQIVRIMLATSAILPFQFIITTICQACNMILIGLLVGVATQVFILPACFIIIYYVSFKYIPEDVWLRYRLCILSFTFNDILSGVVSIGVWIYSMRKLKRLARAQDVEKPADKR
ncbi:Na+ driven multidrug efflux pump [Giardia duodenalis]|uniref:Na+ driven multidrug efflux pump n=1 Tax=Giardia intestinalis (strain ATCC 50803 / WB clone C6) TaxID=184922 RepID=A8BK77_GIAIC|nr:Na+ driven multidrug efflux pump [Giardia intestinalis]KAE8301524.1 Na+ driven multidrug efflux pump [Giardia intestinalis]|eukprot:XP_001706475.1 Na+ driven multidrug efflux pump [Giardia lamblia ATCC 50803]